MIIHPGDVSPRRSSRNPELGEQPHCSCLRCTRWGLPGQNGYPSCRCALTAPFHPYRLGTCALSLGGLLSVALAVGLPRPGVTWHRALWCPDFPRADHLAQGMMAARDHPTHSSIPNGIRGAANDDNCLAIILDSVEPVSFPDCYARFPRFPSCPDL